MGKKKKKEVDPKEPRCGRFHEFGPELLKYELKSFKSVLDAYDIPFFLIGGCALGLIRDGSFLQHDKDFDIGIFADVDLDRLTTALKDVYVNVSVDGVPGGKYIWANKLFGNKILVFDIQVHYKKGNIYYMNRFMGKTFKKENKQWHMEWDAKHFENLTSWKFADGDRYNLPSFIEEYFVAQHGEDWYKPKQYADWRYHAKSLKEGWL
jgi:hypothetical protein